jgi:ligand-binding SRPBCC domain-containing protein
MTAEDDDAAHSLREQGTAMRFVKESVIEASAKRVFAFHEAPDAFERLQPPWQQAEIVQPPTSLEVGTRVELRIRLGPFWQTLIAEHVAYEPGKMFADRMLKGPFASWLHRHIVSPRGPDRCVLTDDIEYELPLGLLGRIFGGALARRQLEQMFDYRHEVTRRACEEDDPPGLSPEPVPETVGGDKPRP